MIHQIIFSPRSLRDLTAIHRRINAQAGSTTVADRLVKSLLEACQSLANFPERFAIYPRARPWRMMPVGDYLVFFKVEGSEVRIGHIRFAARKPFRG